MAVTAMNSWSHSHNRDPDLGIKNSLKAAIQVEVQSIGARLTRAWMNDCDLHCTENLCVCQLHIRGTSCMWIYSSVEDCKTTNVHNYHGAKVSNVRLQTTHRQLHTNNEHMLGHSKQQSRSQTPLKGGSGNETNQTGAMSSSQRRRKKCKLHISRCDRLHEYFAA